MIFLDNLEKPDDWNTFIECPKCKYQFEIKRTEDKILY